MSERLRRLYIQKHKNCPNYGVSAKRHIERIKDLIPQRKWKTFLDYGCGKAVLSKEIPGIVNYDFAIPEYDNLPDGRFDVAFCIDVLEHIPKEELHATLEYLQSHAKEVYFCVYLELCGHHLPNGEPCHCTVENAAWWIDKLGEYWNHIELVNCGKLRLTVIAS